MCVSQTNLKGPQYFLTWSYPKIKGLAFAFAMTMGRRALLFSGLRLLGHLYSPFCTIWGEAQGTEGWARPTIFVTCGGSTSTRYNNGELVLFRVSMHCLEGWIFIILHYYSSVSVGNRFVVWPCQRPLALSLPYMKTSGRTPMGSARAPLALTLAEELLEKPAPAAMIGYDAIGVSQILTRWSGGIQSDRVANFEVGSRRLTCVML
jgi:hypothetical protein